MLRALHAASQADTAVAAAPPARPGAVVLPIVQRPDRGGRPLRPGPAATLFDFRACRASASHLKSALALEGGAPQDGTAAPPAAETASAFTTADRIALLAWHNSGAGGYARLVIEDGKPGVEPDRGAYALLYLPGSCWAAFGVTRRGNGIVAWHCGTGAAYGAFSSMAAALAALPRASKRAH